MNVQFPIAQPYMQGQATRNPGMALSSMLAGRTMYGQNPMDQQRAAMWQPPQRQAPPMQPQPVFNQQWAQQHSMIPGGQGLAYILSSGNPSAWGRPQ